MRKLQIGIGSALLFLTGGVGTPAEAYTAEITFTASEFIARSGVYLTGEIPPQAEVSGSFTVSTDQPRDIPDTTGSEAEDGSGYQVVNTWTSPLAADLQIAGTPYAAPTIQVHMGFVEGEIALILVSARAGRLPEELPAHVTTTGTEDFYLTVDFPGPASEGNASAFGYTVDETDISGFVALRGHITVASDSGPIQEFDWVPPLVVEGIPCYVARPSPGEGTELEGGAAPGELICDDPDAPDDGPVSGAADRLRDARLSAASAARAAAGGTVTLTTQLGTLTLETGSTDRVLLAAASGRSAQVQPPDAAAGSYDCAKVRRAPGTPRFQRLDDVQLTSAPQKYKLTRPTRYCVASAEATTADLLCYAAKAKGRGKSRSELWVAHELGVEKLRVGRASELCLPVAEGE